MRVIFAVKYSGDEYIGLMRISSILRNKGYQVEAVEAEYNKVKERLKDGLPTVLAYSAPTIFVSHYLKLNKRIKERFNVFSVFGGPHPTAVPEMIKEDGVDGVCIGEGEFAMLELVDNLCSGRPVNDIKNWWIKENGKVFKNPLRPLIKDLDSLPFPDRELFKNHALFDRERIYILTGRGCPYACSFCFNPYYNKIYEGQMTSIRKRSVENVIEEIRRFKKDFPLKFVRFYDDIFILPFG
ncbi:MAG: cobalamin-dependent protein, partial [Candidatus Omnitrophica bacterium]|nr:cobalamin-dependent protein [Candidatus Omnitrophota bacterium]